MPELPEVETIARGVDARVRGDRIVEAWFGSHREPFKTPPGPQARGLEGRVILAVHRTGKHIVCELGGTVCGGPMEQDNGRVGAQWIVHLGMTGRLLVTTPDGPVAPHTHARLTLGSGQELRFVDPRRFGRLEFRDLGRSKGFAGPGAEPLSIRPEEFTALFRRRRLAIKAALLNLISIGAAYGVLVAVFQWGWGRSLTGVSENVPIESYVPMMMFAIVFGLSMDYEIFLLSRIQEAWKATGDSARAVASGLASTARVITCAALIMVCVFAAFVVSTTVVVKMLAVGLAAAVVIDASIVRLVLVPAFMFVLGDNNWWLPGWLDRILPHLEPEGDKHNVS